MENKDFENVTISLSRYEELKRVEEDYNTHYAQIKLSGGSLYSPKVVVWSKDNFVKEFVTKTIENLTPFKERYDILCNISSKRLEEMNNFNRLPWYKKMFYKFEI